MMALRAVQLEAARAPIMAESIAGCIRTGPEQIPELGRKLKNHNQSEGNIPET